MTYSILSFAKTDFEVAKSLFVTVSNVKSFSYLNDSLFMDFLIITLKY